MITPRRLADWRTALAAPHRVYTRVDVWNGDLSEQLIEGLPFADGSVDATLQSRVARRLRLSLDSDAGAMEELEPWGNNLVAWRGIDWGGGDIEAFRVFVGRIQTLDVGRTCAVDALDRASDVVEAHFMRPYEVGSRRLHAETKHLISEAIPDAEFGSFTAPDVVVPSLLFEQDRGQALDEIAAGAGALWYPLAGGEFVLRNYPWEEVIDPVMILTDGPGGIISEASYRLDRTAVHNAIRAVGERADGSLPAEAIVYDTDPASPWYYKGNFGFRPRTVNVQSASDYGLVRLTAESTLHRHQSLGETWTWTQAGDPTMELGDVAVLEVGTLHRDVHQVITGFNLPLGAGPMTVSGRSHTHGEVTEVA